MTEDSVKDRLRRRVERIEENFREVQDELLRLRKENRILRRQIQRWKEGSDA